MEQHFVVMRLKRRATLLALSKYEFTFNVYDVFTNNDLLLSYFMVVGLTIAGLFIALLIIAVAVWIKKFKRIQKRLKRVELEIVGDSSAFHLGPMDFEEQEVV